MFIMRMWSVLSMFLVQFILQNRLNADFLLLLRISEGHFIIVCLIAHKSIFSWTNLLGLCGFSIAYFMVEFFQYFYGVGLQFLFHSLSDQLNLALVLWGIYLLYFLEFELNLVIVVISVHQDVFLLQKFEILASEFSHLFLQDIYDWFQLYRLLLKLGRTFFLFL